MASSAKKNSGWGSFFEKAVGGLESKLDTILADETDEPPKSTSKPNGKPKTGNLSRNASQRRSEDRLQERLARAMVKASVGGTPRTGSPRSSFDKTSVTSSSVPKESSSRSSLDAKPEEPRQNSAQTSAEDEIVVVEKTPQVANVPPIILSPPIQPETPIESVESTEDSDTRRASHDVPVLAPNGVNSSPCTSNSDESEIAKLQAGHEASQLRLKEELHKYVEQIDTLQSKLQYLAKESVESAKNAAESAEKGSLEQKLAEKDERIALLMIEGQQLSKTELRHMTAIKSLRAQLDECNKALGEDRKKLDKLDKAKTNAEERAKRAEDRDKKTAEKLRALESVGKELEEQRTEKISTMATLADLQEQLVRAVSRAEEAESRAQTEATEDEKQRMTSLLDELSNAKIERELSEEKMKRQNDQLQEQLAQEKQRSKTTESELKSELRAQESRLEALRSQAEEASSGNRNDAQAKLLRQMEMLQTQYTVASENWQGIEGSLLARITALEKERDDVSKREGDLRKRVREANVKLRRVEEELEGALSKASVHEQELFEKDQKIVRLQRQLESAAEDLARANRGFAKDKESLTASYAQKLEEEKAKWQEERAPSGLVNQLATIRAESPAVSIRQHSSADLFSLQSRQRGKDRVPASDTGYYFATGSPFSRRPSAQPVPISELGTPPRPESATSSNHPGIGSHSNKPFNESPPNATVDQDEILEVGSSATPKINDMISMSTVAAGPSVQLVERMSAAVRRLESERAASKDELARLSAQRDEARQEVADLMREVEQKKMSDERIKVLEHELDELTQRYETTLEMLGEKSERVDELQADVADLKKIYRELVDSTMR